MSALRKIAYANNNDQGQQYSGAQLAGASLGTAGLAGGGMYAYQRNQMGKSQQQAEDKFNTERAAHVQTQTQLAQKAREVEQINGQFNDLGERHKQLVNTGLDLLNTSEKYKNDLNTERAAHAQTAQELGNANTQLEQKAREVEAEKAAHAQTAQELNAEKAAHAQTKYNNLTELQGAKNEINLAAGENKRLSSKLMDTEKAHQQAQADLANKQATYMETRKALSTEKKRHQHTMMEHLQEQKNHEQTAQELGNANTQLEQAARQNELQKQYISNMHERAYKSGNNIQGLNNQLEQKSREIAQQQNTIKNADKKNNAIINSARQHKSNYNNLMLKDYKNKQRLLNENKKYENDFYDMANENYNYKKVKGNYSNAQKGYADLRNENQDLKQRHNDLFNKNKKYESDFYNIADENYNLKNTKANYLNAQKGYADLHNQNQDLKQRLGNLNNQNMKTEKENKFYNKYTDGLEDNVRDLHDQLNQERSKSITSRIFDKVRNSHIANMFKR